MNHAVYHNQSAIYRTLELVVATAALMLAIFTPTHAEKPSQPPPEKSIAKIQNILAAAADKLWEISDELFHEGYYKRSAAVLRLITEIDPTDVQAYAVASWLLDSSGYEKEGLALLELGLARNPSHYDLYAEIGDRYDHIEDYGKAAEYYEKALEFFECPLIYLHSLAHAYEKSGQLEKSLYTWQRAAQAEPNSPVVKNNLERVKAKLDALNKPREP